VDQYSNLLPDLIVNICPLGCDGKCAEIWINDAIDHRIICDCLKCGHNNNKKCETLAEVERPVANAIHNAQSNSQESVQRK
jgi:Zn ribbon nucleic-acid-binding protein